jgi:DNA-binding transcriptional LysR family regulator
MSAVNVDLAKALVENGLGLAILPSIVCDPRKDKQLAAIDVGHLFPAHAVYVTLRKHHYLRGYAYEFISMVAPALSRQKVEAAIFGVR